ncbi:hypothetical protein [Paenibacillus odorifer]|uniref:hypothetical protein n=1 Tax=Paenibacillus odorifer TaxID=189426 RepID=UPI001C4B71A5|nr:hypothetical protein [Paenibacillus odorifer]
MMDDGYFRTQMTLFAKISALEQGFGLLCSYSPEKAAFGVFFRPIATMRTVRIPKVEYDAFKCHLSPLDASGRANVIQESVAWEFDDGRWLLSDPDDVICEDFGFGARFRTPVQLFPRKGCFRGVFQANNGYAVR